MDGGLGYSLKNLMAAETIATEQRKEQILEGVPNPSGVGGPGYNIEAATSQQTFNPYYNATANQDSWASQGFPPGGETRPISNAEMAQLRGGQPMPMPKDVAPPNRVSVRDLGRPKRRYDLANPFSMGGKNSMVFMGVGLVVLAFLMFYFFAPASTKKSVSSAVKPTLPNFSNL
jgi:hypothetical protein